MPQFACHVLLPERLDDEEAQVIAGLQLSASARAQGVDVDLATLEVAQVERNRINGEVLLTEEEREAGMTGREVLLRAAAVVV